MFRLIIFKLKSVSFSLGKSMASVWKGNLWCTCKHYAFHFSLDIEAIIVCACIYQKSFLSKQKLYSQNFFVPMLMAIPYMVSLHKLWTDGIFGTPTLQFSHQTKAN